MFGYVRPPLELLSKDETERFRRMYCGLCHTLGKRYGVAARFILNYDFTYLAILLAPSEEGACGQGRCVVKGFKCKEFRETDAALELAADVSVILAYWQIRDEIADHNRIGGLKYRSISAVLSSAYRKAASLRPDYDAIVRRQLKQLKELEHNRCDSIDRAADTFAALLSSAADEITDPVRKRVLEQLLYHLGRWIYLIDAADDLKEDAKSGNYNPVALRFGLTDGNWDANTRREFVMTLDHSVHMMTTAFELWDFGVWNPILKTTLYEALFSVGKAVLDGTFRKESAKENRKISKEG